MSLAMELFLTAIGMIFTIVVIAELVWKSQKLIRKGD
jgi:hypothetical protein